MRNFVKVTDLDGRGDLIMARINVDDDGQFVELVTSVPDADSESLMSVRIGLAFGDITQRADFSLITWDLLDDQTMRELADVVRKEGRELTNEEANALIAETLANRMLDAMKSEQQENIDA